ARYLVPLIPLLGLFLLDCRGWMRRAVMALAAVSFAINFAAAAVDPQPSGTIPRPLTQYIVPLLLRGHFSPAVPITPPWSAATFTGHTSVNRLTHDEAVVFQRHPPGSLEAEWASFNLAQPFFGPGDALSLIPIALLRASSGVPTRACGSRSASPRRSAASPAARWPAAAPAGPGASDRSRPGAASPSPCVPSRCGARSCR